MAKSKEQMVGKDENMMARGMVEDAMANPKTPNVWPMAWFTKQALIEYDISLTDTSQSATNPKGLPTLLD